MGRYPISLINEISSKNIKLINVENFGNIVQEKFYIEGYIGNIDLKIIFGVGKYYENISINFKNREK